VNEQGRRTAIPFPPGRNLYIDWEHDLVVVVRRIKDEATLNEFLGRVIGALNDAK